MLLRTLLSRSSEEWPSAEDKSDLSSLRGSSSLLADTDVKPTQTVCKQLIPGNWGNISFQCMLDLKYGDNTKTI